MVFSVGMGCVIVQCRMRQIHFRQGVGAAMRMLLLREQMEAGGVKAGLGAALP